MADGLKLRHGMPGHHTRALLVGFGIVTSGASHGPEGPALTRVAFGSCNKPRPLPRNDHSKQSMAAEPQPMWAEIARFKPDAFFW